MRSIAPHRVPQFVLAIASLTTSFLWAQSQAPAGLPASANQLVRQVVQNELNGGKTKTHYMFRMHKETPTGTQTREYVETADGTITRVVAINDQPLSPEARASEDERLRSFARWRQATLQ